MKITPVRNYFKGIYLSNALAPGIQRNKAKEIRDEFLAARLSEYYEQKGQDILIKPGKYDAVEISFVPYRIDRILNDDYTRWNGRLN